MNKTPLVATLLVSVVVLTGCETISSSPYTASSDNVIQFQETLTNLDTTVALGSFTENEDQGAISLTCRLNGTIDVTAGKLVSDYMREAMQTELLQAQAYATDSEVEIVGNVDSVQLRSVTPASWDIEVTVSSNIYEGYSIATSHPFGTSFSAINACQNAANAFGPAVQSMIKEVVSHPEFVSLVGQQRS